jgi:hypothetical protein
MRIPDRVNCATLIMNFEKGSDIIISTNPQKYR